MEEEFSKLTNLVYKALEFFPESDPLKNRAKEKTLNIMESLVSFQANGISHKKITEDIDILLGFLQVGKSLGWLNSINYLIISKEYQKIRAGLNLKHPHSQEKEKEKIKVPGFILSEALTEKPLPAGQITERQRMILDFLNKNEKAQVMDLQALFPSITKRTIRRDLDELLQKNQIIRVGDYNQVSYRLKDRTFAS